MKKIVIILIISGINVINVYAQLRFVETPEIKTYAVTPEEKITKQVLYINGEPYLIKRDKRGKVISEQKLTPELAQKFAKVMKSTKEEVERIERLRKQGWTRERQREGYKIIPVEGFETPRQPGRPLYEKEQREVIQQELKELEE